MNKKKEKDWQIKSSLKQKIFLNIEKLSGKIEFITLLNFEHFEKIIKNYYSILSHL